MDEILEILETDSRRSPAEIATMTGTSEAAVKAAIADYEAKNIITAYTALINWELTDREKVTALIEVKMIPQKERGFDKVAERIRNHPEVTACYLMSGGYDLMVVIEGKTMKEVALFVAENLAAMEQVTSTVTHFVLKKYKDKGIVFGAKPKDDRENLRL